MSDCATVNEICPPAQWPWLKMGHLKDLLRGISIGDKDKKKGGERKSRGGDVPP